MIREATLRHNNPVAASNEVLASGIPPIVIRTPKNTESQRTFPRLATTTATTTCFDCSRRDARRLLSGQKEKKEKRTGANLISPPERLVSCQVCLLRWPRLGSWLGCCTARRHKRAAWRLVSHDMLPSTQAGWLAGCVAGPASRDVGRGNISPP